METQKINLRKDLKYAISEIFSSIQGEGYFVGEPTTFIRFYGCNLFCGYCLIPNTRIYSENGTKKAKDIKIGERILGKGSKGELELQVVQDIFRREVSGLEIIKITFDHGISLFVTKEHPIYSIDRGQYVRAKELQIDELIDRLPRETYLSWKMKNYNPMKDKNIVKKVADSVRKGYGSGKIKPYLRTEEWRKNQSNCKKIHNPMFDPEIVVKNMKSHKHRPSGLEKIAINEFEMNNLPIEYVGNAKLWIGNKIKKFRNPDFKVIGQKKIIELYDPTYMDRDERWSEERKIFFKNFGWECLMLDVNGRIYQKNNNGRNNMIDRVNRFITNGTRVTSISKVSNPKQLVRMGARRIKNCRHNEGFKHYPECYQLTVYNFRTSNHNYYANGILAHNCDTPYAVPELIKMRNLPTEFVPMNSEDIMKRIQAFANAHVIFTGGEPLVQEGLAELLIQVKEEFPWIRSYEIETNGTIIFEQEPFPIYYDVSPKLSNSKMPRDKRIIAPALKWFNRNSRTKFKFVIGRKEDIKEVFDDFLQPFQIPTSKTYFMPLGIDAKTITRNSIWLVEECKKYGIRYSPRLQIMLYGNERGT